MLVFWAVYLAGIAGLRGVSRVLPFQRSRSLGRWVSAVHNLVLAGWSAIMFVGIVSALLQTVASKADGLAATFCSRDFGSFPPSIYYWLYMFYLSKPYELLDTLLLAARGKPLTALHVWHHLSVVAEAWCWLQYGLTFAAYGMLFNTAVHTLMYTYFAYASLGWRFPLKRYITQFQIVQFVASFVLTVPYLLLYRQRRHGCLGMPALLVSTFCNASYLALFVQFYKRTYGRPPARKVL